MLRVLALAACVRLAASKAFPGCIGSTTEGCPGTHNCTTHFFEQTIDHFNWAPPLGGDVATYQQRYFVNKQWWSPGKPIFFYFGNEDDVELYVNHTGLMWENAEEFGAMLVFAEHRYYGKSLPFASGTKGCMSWLTTEQALADFAELIDDLQAQYGGGSRLPIVGFGGSYGGMMAAWFRVKYPQFIDGVVAASAPIWSFDGMSPPYDFNAYYQGVTFDASAAGGSSDRCKNNLKAAWPKILEAGASEAGAAKLTRAFRTCAPVVPRSEAADMSFDIVMWAEEVWANMAMGNFPYASSYLMHGKSLLPAWPVRTACEHLDADFDDDEALFEAVRSAVATQYNNTGAEPCFDFSNAVASARGLPRWRGHNRRPSSKNRAVSQESCAGDWDYQWCTEMTQPFTQGTDKDMYFCSNGTIYEAENCSFWDFEAEASRCEENWGVRPRKDWARVGLSSKRLESASNIVFSNGRLDPWHFGGILQNISETVVAVIIENGAHHIDLMFTDPVDVQYPDILAAREFERQHMMQWVDEASHKLSEIEIAI